MPEQIRVLLADENRASREALESAIAQRDELTLVASVTNGQEALQAVLHKNVDVVVTGLILPQLDGFGLLEAIQQSTLEPKPRVIVLTTVMREDIIKKALEAGATYYMLKPFDAQLVLKRIGELARPGQVTLNALPRFQLPSLDERIADIFLTIGIPAHIGGYGFLREAIKEVVHNPQAIKSITKELYPTVARRFNTTASKVERGIRHAIEVAWSRGQAADLNRLLSGRAAPKTDKPTNGELIALIADRLHIERVQ